VILSIKRLKMHGFLHFLRNNVFFDTNLYKFYLRIYLRGCSWRA